MARRSKNLSLDAAAVERGERYSELHDTNVSRLVSNFLASLPVDGSESESTLSPAVRRLLGVGAGTTDREAYRRHLLAKYAR